MRLARQKRSRNHSYALKFSAAATKSLQSCPTLCDPTDGSPPGSPTPGILQARTLEWVAISFSNAGRWKVKVKSLSRVWPSVTPWTAATRLLCPWVFPGKSTGVGCYCLLRTLFYFPPNSASMFLFGTGEHRPSFGNKLSLNNSGENSWRWLYYSICFTYNFWLIILQYYNITTKCSVNGVSITQVLIFHYGYYWHLIILAITITFSPVYVNMLDIS